MKTSRIFLITIFSLFLMTPAMATEPTEQIAMNSVPVPEASVSSVQILDPTPVKGYSALKQKIEYPEFARDSKIDGRLVVKAYIDETGHVKQLHTIEGIEEPGFKEAVANALKETEWTPATYNGQAKPCFLEMAFEFKLSE